MLKRVAAQTGTDRALLEQLVHLDDDGPRISIPGLKLGKNNAEATRTIVEILTIVRDFGLGEKETHIDVIRKEADRLRVYDTGNFSTYINTVTGFQVVGSGSSRRLRAKSPGIAAFPELVDRLVGKS